MNIQMSAFWIDLIVYGAVAVISAVQILVVLGAGIRRRVNLLFAWMMLMIALWTGTAVVLRVSLWRVWQAGPVQQFWMEISSLAFLLIAPLMLAFSAAYIETKARWPYWLSLLGLAGIGLFAVPLFRHQVVYNVHITPSGVISWDRTPLAFILSLPQTVGPILSLVLLWQERRIRDYSLMAAFTLMLVSSLLFSVIQVNFPSLSLTTLVVVVLLAYAVLNRQLFRPLRELTRELEKRVEERTRELAETSLRLQEANRDLARRTAQLEAASAVARRAAEIHAVDALLNETVRLISDRFGFYHAGIFLIDEAREYVVLRAASSEGGQRMLARGHRLAVGEEGIVGYVAGTGKPRIALDVGEDAVFFSNPDLPHTRSEMALPLKVGEQVIGVLDVQSVEPSAFTDEDVTVLQTMADQIALAIENARLLAEVQDRLREVETLSREYVRREWEQMVSERPGWGYIYDGVEVRPRERVSPPEGVSPGITVPLQLATGETIGQVALALPHRPPTDEDVALAQAVAQQAALALESARLFQETRRTLEEMESLFRASEAINTASTPDDVLRAFVDHVVPPQIDRCVLALLDPESPSEEMAVDAVAAWDRGKERSPSLGRRWSIAQIPFIARRSTEPVVISDVATYPDVDEVSRYVFMNVLGVRAVLGIPLVAGGRLLGWLMVESLTRPYEFSEREVRLYRTLADQAALALERMRLFEETRRRAEWERIRAEVAARVRASTDIETILRTAVREMGRAFRAAEGVIQLHGGDGRKEGEWSKTS
ncbi:MAG: GAF domain-containing protein [Anaerolineae bacterium]